MDESFAQAAEKWNRWFIKAEFTQLVKEVDRRNFDIAPTIVNAYHMWNRNNINFPAAVFQSPLFDEYFPKSMNFGAIGSLIAHEISHGFDDLGNEY